VTKLVPYYRVSTKHQGTSGLGLEAQQATVQRYVGQSSLAGAKGDKVLLPAFVEVESGKRNDRPELDKALRRCRVHKATLIVAKVDRLTRSMSFLQKLLDANVPVVFCDLPAQHGAIGRFMLQQMVAVAELEAGLISERTKAALSAKVARDGQWDRKAKHHLVPGAGQEAAVRARQEQAQAFASDTMETIQVIQAQGITSASGIARELNEQGITTPRGGQWQAVQVQRVLGRV
jgi:DNA invertase Pin-like site-specific DNA recombinase